MRNTCIFAVIVLLVSHAVGEHCYAMDGTELDERYQPCYPNSGAKGSACCQLNGTQGENQQNDLCLDSGLCMSTSGWFASYLYINGCTDPTGKADGCPQLCSFKGNQYSWSVLQCKPGVFCCRAASDEVTNCCNDNSSTITTSHIGNILLPGSTYAINTTFNFTTIPAVNNNTDDNSTCVTNGLGLSNTTTGNATCPPDHTVAVGGAVGGVLGAGLLAALVALAFALKSRKHYKSDGTRMHYQMETIKADAAHDKANFQKQLEEHQQYVQSMPPNYGVASPVSQLQQTPSPNGYSSAYQPGPIMQMAPQHFGLASGLVPPPQQVPLQPSPRGTVTHISELPSSNPNRAEMSGSSVWGK